MDGYEQGTEKFAPRYDKCLRFGGYCVGKWLDCGTVKRQLFLLDFKIKNPKYNNITNQLDSTVIVY